MNIQNILKDLGFKDKKARVYMACLELGQANAQDIAKKADIERTSVYALLDSLAKDGLIGITIKNKTRFIVPEPPQKLTELLKSKLSALEKALPLLMAFSNTSHIKPTVRFYEELEGIKEVVKDTLNCQEKIIRNLPSTQDALEFLGKDFLSHYIEQRVAKKIKVRSLRPQGKELNNWYLKAGNKEVMREVRFLPSGVSFNVLCMIYDYKVAIISSKKEKFGFLVESKEFSELMKALYDLAWENATQYSISKS
ncbi:MAG: helix-turn-helix domain-containing protein [bacterium]